MSSSTFNKPLNTELNNLTPPSNAITVTAASTGWSNETPSTQTISAAGVTVSNNIAVGLSNSLTSEQRAAAKAADLACTLQGNGTITLTCYGTKPTINIPITVFIFG